MELSMGVINRVLTFWSDGNLVERRKAWFVKSADFDSEIETKFRDDVRKASFGVYDTHAQTPYGALTLMNFLDQFPRNMFRVDPKLFATDLKALRIAKRVIANFLDIDLNVIQILFFYLPFEHSENRDDQNRAIVLSRELSDESYLKSAISHQDVISRFERLPHQNKALVRPTTLAEREFLNSFGSFWNNFMLFIVYALYNWKLRWNIAI